MTRQAAPAVDGVRRRPKDRKAQIARVAAEAFSALGYHEVTVETIATRVGISAPALYRHYASKYDLFRGAVLTLSQEFVDAINTVDAGDRPADFDEVMRALFDVILRNRATGGLHRWQARYLHSADAAVLADHLRIVSHRIQAALAVRRPELNAAGLLTLASGALSTAGSVVDHQVRASDDYIRAVLTAAVTAVAAAELPDPAAVAGAGPARRVFTADAGIYEALLQASMVLFARNGYTETTMAQIAAAVDLPVSGIYRYYQSKSDILASMLRRAADRLSAQLTGINHATEARGALTQLVTAYVASSFANPELATVYYSERVNLEPGDQTLLRNVQRSTIGSWVQLLIAMRPELDPRAARFLIHAAMSLVVDLGWLAEHDPSADESDPSAYTRACVVTLMQAVLFDSEL